MMPKTPQEAIMHIEESLEALRSHFDEDASSDDEPEMEKKMIGRGRKRRESVAFKKRDEDEEDSSDY